MSSGVTNHDAALADIVRRIPGAGPVRDLFEFIADYVGAECTTCETEIVNADRCSAELTHDLIDWLAERGVTL